MDIYKIIYKVEYYVRNEKHNKEVECLFNNILDISNAFGLSKKEVENFYTEIRPKKVDCVIKSIEKIKRELPINEKFVVNFN